MSSGDIGAILGRIEKQVFARRVRAKDFFKDYDKLRSGRVTKPQFTRVILTMGLQIPHHEAELLAEHFTEDGPRVQHPQVVNYKAFCDCIDECFGVLVGLESNPDQRVPLPGENVPAAFTPNPVDDMAQLDHVLHRLALMCKARGVVFKYCYQDFERGDAASLIVPRRGGKCTISQFKRKFPFVKDFDALEVDLLIDHYLTDQDLVHFAALDADIVEHMSSEIDVPCPKSEMITRHDPTQWSHDEVHVVHKVQARVVERRLRLTEHFQDFDPLRKGFCNAGQVKTVLALMKIPLEPADHQELLQVYTRDDGQFCYAAFCADVDSAFTVNGLEKQPLARITMTDASSTIHARRNYITMAEEQKEALARLEEGIRARIRTRRILVRPEFHHYDTTHRGHVTRKQFARCMDALGFQMDQSSLDLLCLAYCDLGNHIDFNYHDFCKTCDPPSQEDGEAMAQENAPYRPHKSSEYFDARGRIHPQPLGVVNQ